MPTFGLASAAAAWPTTANVASAMPPATAAPIEAPPRRRRSTMLSFMFHSLPMYGMAAGEAQPAASDVMIGGRWPPPRRVTSR